MNPKQARAALMQHFKQILKEKSIESGSADLEGLIDAQINIILKKGKGAWDGEIAKKYIELDFPSLFKKLGA